MICELAKMRVFCYMVFRLVILSSVVQCLADRISAARYKDCKLAEVGARYHERIASYFVFQKSKVLIDLIGFSHHK
jgi:hypothetical protein